MIGYRRAALCLHGLSESDRAWVLQSLPDGQRLELTRLLSELQAMGVPRDKSWLPHMPGGLNTGKDTRIVVPPGMELVALLEAVPINRVMVLLEGEPDEVIAILLHCHRWNWRQAVIEALKPMRCAHVMGLQPDAWSARVRDAVLEALLAKYRSIVQQHADGSRALNGNGSHRRWRWFPTAGKRAWRS